MHSIIQNFLVSTWVPQDAHIAAMEDVNYIKKDKGKGKKKGKGKGNPTTTRTATAALLGATRTTLGVVSPHLPPKIFRAILSFLVNSRRFSPHFSHFLSVLVDFPSFSVSFSQFSQFRQQRKRKEGEEQQLAALQAIQLQRPDAEGLQQQRKGQEEQQQGERKDR